MYTIVYCIKRDFANIYPVKQTNCMFNNWGIYQFYFKIIFMQIAHKLPVHCTLIY